MQIKSGMIYLIQKVFVIAAAGCRMSTRAVYSGLGDPTESLKVQISSEYTN